MKASNNTLTEKGVWADLLLLAAAFFLLFAALGCRGLWGSEGRWAEVTREMMQSGDYFHPTIGGEPYFDKPLLTYWFIVLIAKITGSLNEWVVRAPSVLAGIAAIWATRSLGKRLWSVEVGRLAAWLLLTSYGVMMWSRTAAADTENLAAIIIAVAWYWSRRDRAGFWVFLVFYLVIFLGALTKGLAAVAIPILVILPDLLRENRWKMLFRPGHILALVIAVVIYFAPFIYASMHKPAGYQSSGLALVFQENIQRYLSPLDHKAPFYIYLYSVPALVFPWAALLIAALAGMAGNWKKFDKHTRWLLLANGLVFLFFTLSGSRRSYYILPILPFCVLLIAVFLLHTRVPELDTARKWGLKIQQIIMLGFLAAEFLGCIVMLFFQVSRDISVPPWLYIANLALGLLALVMAMIFYRSKYAKQHYSPEQRMLFSQIAMGAVLLGGFFVWQQSILEGYRTERSFVQELKRRMVAEKCETVSFFPKVDAKLCFYLDTSKPFILKDTDSWRELLAKPKGKVIIMQRKYIVRIPQEFSHRIPGEPDMAEQSKPWDSKSAWKKKWVAWFPEKYVSVGSQVEEVQSIAEEK